MTEDAERIGRPSSYTSEAAHLICTRIAQGEGLLAICKDKDTPDYSTVMRWLGDEKREAFREKYARARERQADALFDEAIIIADDAQGDWVTDEHGQRVFNHEHVQRSRLRVDTRKWAAARLSPRKYGDKLLHTGADGTGPARIVIEIAGWTGAEAETLPLAPGSPPSPGNGRTAPLAIEVVDDDGKG